MKIKFSLLFFFSLLSSLIELEWNNRNFFNQFAPNSEELERKFSSKNKNSAVKRLIRKSGLPADIRQQVLIDLKKKKFFSFHHPITIIFPHLRTHTSQFKKKKKKRLGQWCVEHIKNENSKKVMQIWWNFIKIRFPPPPLK